MRRNKKLKELRLGYVGQRIFLVSVFLLLVFGFALPKNIAIIILMLCLGFVIGILNITEQETVPFLVASIVLLLASNTFIALPYVGELFEWVLKYLLFLVTPAAFVVALWTFYKLASSR